MKNTKLRALKEFYEDNFLQSVGYELNDFKDLSLSDINNLDIWLLELGEVYNYVASSIIDLYREMGKVEYCKYKVSDYFLSNDNVDDAIKVLDPYSRNLDYNQQNIWYEMLSKYAYLEDYENVTKEIEDFENGCIDACMELNEWQPWVDLTNAKKEYLEEELKYHYDSKEEIDTILEDCWF